jgi:UDP-3-O-[3-hydroxymyristoyl] glucosamine N-acyltransferase
MVNFSAKDIAAIINGDITGNADYRISKISKIEEADEESLCFIANPKYVHYANTAKAGVLLVNKTLEVNNPSIHAIIRVNDAYQAFTVLLKAYQKLTELDAQSGIEQHSVLHSSVVYGQEFYLGSFSYVAKNAKIGSNVKIYPGCYIGEEVTIGNNTTIHAGVKIYAGCIIGDDCIIHSGAVIGCDGFGYVPTADGYDKIPQTGIVKIGNNVEIGANTTVDRATMGATLIENGVKLDNLIMVAHNVEIGEHTAVAAQAGFSGSTKVGKRVVVGGQVGTIGHIKIGDDVKVNAKSAVAKDIENGRVISGIPAIDIKVHFRQIAAIKQLPDLMMKVAVLERELAKIKGGIE